MSINSTIDWTNATWNPVTGCSKASPGCDNCYAEKQAKRLQGMGKPKYRNGFAVTCHPQEFKVLAKWNKPMKVFVCSMADLFHQAVPESFIHQVFQAMNQWQHLTFQVLTKRAERLAELAPMLPWSSNIWAGVTIESDAFVHRADLLRGVPAAVKYVSLEPLLGPLPSLNVTGLDWIIVGGESGISARPMDADWVRDLRDRAIRHGIPFFFKQWGGRKKKVTGRTLDGRTWSQFPRSPQVIRPVVTK